jgi:ketosteroid isomerase-like protein
VGVNDGVAVLQAVGDAFAARSREALGQLFADDIVMLGTIGGLDEQRVMRGREAVLDYFEEIVDPWNNFEVDFEQVVKAPEDTYVVLMREVGRSPRADIEIVSETAMVLRIRDGVVHEMRGYLDREAALKAAGAS